MRSWARPTAHVALLTAGFVAFGSGVGFADTTSGDASAGSGNQIHAPISVPIDVSGNSAAAAGQSAAKSKGGATVKNKDGGGDRTTSGDGGLLSGNQLEAPISAPISGCGNSLAVGGQSAAKCKGGAKVNNSGSGGGRTSGDGGALSGNQLYAPISAPTDICGNSIAVFGESAAQCEGGASVRNKGGSTGTTSGDGGFLAGNQAYAPVSAPIDICGNSIAIGGQSFATCKGGAEVVNHRDSGGDMTTSGDRSAGGGNQVYAPVSAPVNICGNALAVAGQAAAMCEGGASVHNGSDGDATRRMAAGDGLTTSG
ncbi:MAG: DUF320 domain-containing protein, partial [Streptosporangiales bacterium]|nr:DUF320 domain-containing protein [Streptosporangiales bacterium]